MRDRAVCGFMRADDEFFFSGVFDAHFSRSMLFCLSFDIHKNIPGTRANVRELLFSANCP